MKNEKRIYVVVPKKVIVPGKKLRMVCGRLMAQVAHVVSKLKLRLKLDPDKEYTTIVLQVKNNEELLRMYVRFLDTYSKIYHLPCEIFWDTNFDFYGTGTPYATAFAAMLTKEHAEFFAGFKLYKC